MGLTDVRQLKRQHIDPDAASPQQSLYEADVDGVLRQARQLRQRLASEVDDSDPQRSTNTKRRQWHRYQEITAELTETADAVIATGLKLGGKPGRALNVAYENLGIALGNAHPADGSQPSRAMLDDILKAGLTPTVHHRLRPLEAAALDPRRPRRHGPRRLRRHHRQPPVPRRHRSSLAPWAPTSATGSSTSWRTAQRAAPTWSPTSSSAPCRLLNHQGNLGLIATNTVAQGDTREVGLKQMVDKGFTITRAIQSKSWPAASANLEYAAVWGTRGEVAAIRSANS